MTHPLHAHAATKAIGPTTPAHGQHPHAVAPASSASGTTPAPGCDAGRWSRGRSVALGGEGGQGGAAPGQAVLVDGGGNPRDRARWTTTATASTSPSPRTAGPGRGRSCSGRPTAGRRRTAWCRPSAPSRTRPGCRRPGVRPVRWATSASQSATHWVRVGGIEPTGVLHVESGGKVLGAVEPTDDVEEGVGIAHRAPRRRSGVVVCAAVQPGPGHARPSRGRTRGRPASPLRSPSRRRS